ncbi:unnamed protein product, partial [Notodromas monacha]
MDLLGKPEFFSVDQIKRALEHFPAASLLAENKPITNNRQEWIRHVATVLRAEHKGVSIDNVLDEFAGSSEVDKPQSPGLMGNTGLFGDSNGVYGGESERMDDDALVANFIQNPIMQARHDNWGKPHGSSQIRFPQLRALPRVYHETIRILSSQMPAPNKDRELLLNASAANKRRKFDDTFDSRFGTQLISFSFKHSLQRGGFTTCFALILGCKNRLEQRLWIRQLLAKAALPQDQGIKRVLTLPFFSASDSLFEDACLYLESLAKSRPPVGNDVYSVLKVLYVKKGYYVRAACVGFELSTRLEAESHGVSPEDQVKMLNQAVTGYCGAEMMLSYSIEDGGPGFFLHFPSTPSAKASKAPQFPNGKIIEL